MIRYILYRNEKRNGIYNGQVNTTRLDRSVLSLYHFLVQLKSVAI